MFPLGRMMGSGVGFGCGGQLLKERVTGEGEGAGVAAVGCSSIGDEEYEDHSFVDRI
jgi:hypothetical protein